MIDHEPVGEVLKELWERTHYQQGAGVPSDRWDQQMRAINKCGRGLQETLSYLYQNRPSFDDFFGWMTSTVDINDADSPVEDVLTSADLLFFQQTGYIVVPVVVSEQQCTNAKNAIIDYLHININDASTWYQPHPEKKGLMVMLYQHPALNANRNSPKIKKIFQQLYGTNKIHKVIEKASFNPPETSSHMFIGSALHWDVSLATPIPFKLQGLLYLNDVDAHGGAFNCVPGFHHKIEEWLQQLPANANPRDEAVRSLQAKAIPGKAGDLVIWHQALPHCATANKSTMPRFVQYITYDPDDYRAQEVWI